MNDSTTHQDKGREGFPLWLWMVVLSILVGVAILISVRIQKSESAIEAMTSPKISRYGMIGDFSLVNQQGESFTRGHIEGKVWAANFIFTSCTTECPILNRRMQEIQTAFQDDPRVEMVSISVDPRTDNPERLRKYAEIFSAGERWTFLTGQPGVIEALITKGFMVSAPESAPEENTAPKRFRQLLHSEKIAVVDQLGVVRFYAEGMNPQSSNQVIDVIRRLLAAESPVISQRSTDQSLLQEDNHPLK